MEEVGKSKKTGKKNLLNIRREGYRPGRVWVPCFELRGGFRISFRRWQIYLQGVAKISQGMAKKS